MYTASSHLPNDLLFTKSYTYVINPPVVYYLTVLNWTSWVRDNRPQTNLPPVQPARKYIPTRPQTNPPPNEPAPR